MGAVLRAWSRAFLSQWHGKMLLMSIAPFLLALGVWAAALYFYLQPLVDYLHALFTEHNLFATSTSWLRSLGLGTLTSVVPPLIAMLALLPLMILTALIFIGVVAMPVIGRHVGLRHFPQLEQRKGGSILGSVGVALGGMLIFIGLWIVTLPLYAFPPLAVLVQALLWGWLTCRVMVYDVLADYASSEERHQILKQHRLRLLAIGVISGAAGALPGAIWLGGVMAVVFFPFLAAASIWLYVLIFIFTGLWFAYYCMDALAQLRAQQEITKELA
ncbi:MULTISPECIES: EI24 domain-containing protein [unclassified Duganella]|uniref:EI24 domain-containing protein n=1 Tax=unclassified Duganella TaxID=2636909 RepID=UPI00088B5805|nr:MULTISPECIES: EI24 domain-containing protein [unclassified Duganella]SDH03379.1 Etoposide-induced protein 2.4 (EI24) [Duganella sp. OV458]SDK22696.1 Etoposide-induced protein 2.4 (EI24) [Duganella sp. OV510]